jgi:hypothetical protein
MSKLVEFISNSIELLFNGSRQSRSKTVGPDAKFAVQRFNICTLKDFGEQTGFTTLHEQTGFSLSPSFSKHATPALFNFSLPSLSSVCSHASRNPIDLPNNGCRTRGIALPGVQHLVP